MIYGAWLRPRSLWLSAFLCGCRPFFSGLLFALAGWSWAPGVFTSALWLLGMRSRGGFRTLRRFGNVGLRRILRFRALGWDGVRGSWSTSFVEFCTRAPQRTLNPNGGRSSRRCEVWVVGLGLSRAAAPTLQARKPTLGTLNDLNPKP